MYVLCDLTFVCLSSTGPDRTAQQQHISSRPYIMLMNIIGDVRGAFEASEARIRPQAVNRLSPGLRESTMVSCATCFTVLPSAYPCPSNPPAPPAPNPRVECSVDLLGVTSCSSATRRTTTKMRKDESAGLVARIDSSYLITAASSCPLTSRVQQGAVASSYAG